MHMEEIKNIDVPAEMKESLKRIKELVLSNKITIEEYIAMTERHILAQEEMIRAARELNASKDEIIETDQEIIAELESYVKLLAQKDESHNAYTAHLHERITKLHLEVEKNTEEEEAISAYKMPFDGWLN